MAIVTSSLDLDDLIRLSADQGLTPKDVMEAHLSHIVRTCAHPHVEAYSASLVPAPENGLEAHFSEADTAAQFMSMLPDQLIELAQVMSAHGGLDIRRGLANWAVITQVVIMNDPEAANKMRPGGSSDPLTRH